MLSFKSFALFTTLACGALSAFALPADPETRRNELAARTSGSAALLDILTTLDTTIAAPCGVLGTYRT